MKRFSRKAFLQTSALAATAMLAKPSLAFVKNEPLLSFSTLGCPDWTFQQITSFARQHGYQGIEVRGLQRQMDLPRCPEFSTAESRQKTMVRMKEKGLSFTNLGASTNLHLPEGPEREKSLASAKEFIALAQQINCPYIRVFPNNFPKDQEKQLTIDLIVKGLVELGDYAKEKGVVVLMETHGDVVGISDLATIMRSASHPNVGLVWDVANMWLITKEPPAEAYRHLKKYIRHTHIKDARWVDGKIAYALLGEGEVPIAEALQVLQKGGYQGFYSFEWEKLWHPEIAGPEVALAHYPLAMKRYF